MPKFKEASHYKKLPEKKVRCMLCPHGCVIGNGEVGKCKVRMNIIGNLKSMYYGKPHTVKYGLTNDLPLYHFFQHVGSVQEFFQQLFEESQVTWTSFFQFYK